MKISTKATWALSAMALVGTLSVSSLQPAQAFTLSSMPVVAKKSIFASSRLFASPAASAEQDLELTRQVIAQRFSSEDGDVDVAPVAAAMDSGDDFGPGMIPQQIPTNHTPQPTIGAGHQNAFADERQ